MQPYRENEAIGPEVEVDPGEIEENTRALMEDGADEVRIRRLPANGYTKARKDKAKAKRRRKMAKRSRARNRK